jgi:hypothetical protein
MEILAIFYFIWLFLRVSEDIDDIREERRKKKYPL